MLNLFIYTFAVKGCLSEDTIQIFLRQLGKLSLYNWLLYIYIYIIKLNITIVLYFSWSNVWI